MRWEKNLRETFQYLEKNNGEFPKASSKLGKQINLQKIIRRMRNYPKKNKSFRKFEWMDMVNYLKIKTKKSERV